MRLLLPWESILLTADPDLCKYTVLFPLGASTPLSCILPENPSASDKIISLTVFLFTRTLPFKGMPLSAEPDWPADNILFPSALLTWTSWSTSLSTDIFSVLLDCLLIFLSFSVLSAVPHIGFPAFSVPVCTLPKSAPELVLPPAGPGLGTGTALSLPAPPSRTACTNSVPRGILSISLDCPFVYPSRSSCFAMVGLSVAASFVSAFLPAWYLFSAAWFAVPIPCSVVLAPWAINAALPVAAPAANSPAPTASCFPASSISRLACFLAARFSISLCRNAWSSLNAEPFPPNICPRNASCFEVSFIFSAARPTGVRNLLLGSMAAICAPLAAVLSPCPPEPCAFPPAVCPVMNLVTTLSAISSSDLIMGFLNLIACTVNHIRKIITNIETSVENAPELTNAVLKILDAVLTNVVVMTDATEKIRSVVSIYSMMFNTSSAIIRTV